MKKSTRKIFLKSLNSALIFGLAISLIFFAISILSAMHAFSGIATITTLFANIYGSLGYSLTPLGIILGTIYAFLDATIIAFIFALVYNKLAKN